MPAPVIGVALEDEIAPGLEPVDDVRRRADGDDIDTGFGEIDALPLRFLQDRPHAEDQRQFAVVLVEGEAHRARAGLFHRLHLGPGPGVARVALGAEGLVGPHHVVHRHRAAVGEARLLAQGELDPGAVGRGLDAFGQQTVEGEGFIVGAAHQGFENHVGQLPGRAALSDHRVERIVAARFGEDDSPALGRIGVDLRQMGEIGGKRRFAIHRDAVHRLGPGGAGPGGGERSGGEECPCLAGDSAEKLWSHLVNNPSLALFGYE